jgi:hypothetical protein
MKYSGYWVLTSNEKKTSEVLWTSEVLKYGLGLGKVLLHLFELLFCDLALGVPHFQNV